MMFVAAGWLLGSTLYSIACAQTYPANTNTRCFTGSDISYGATYVYLPSDQQNLGFYAQSAGTCDSGTYARVHITAPDGTDKSCDYLALNGALQLIQCPGLIRGQLAEGSYTVYWETVPSVEQYSWNQFSISHNQATETAPTPTSTVTTTPTETATQTLTTTVTDTFTSQQVTVTSPSSTATNTILVTPTSATITTTSTKTYTRTRYAWTKTVKTTSYPTPCRPLSLQPCKKGGRRGHKRSLSAHSELVHLSPRDLNSQGIEGAPATASVTPAAAITTSTASATTSTVTVTTQATPNASTTVANPTPTTTLYSGSAITDTTSTLPQSTSTITKCTSTVITTTRTFTITVAKVTPYSGPCRK